jgi:hypothetical protein
VDGERAAGVQLWLLACKELCLERSVDAVYACVTDCDIRGGVDDGEEGCEPKEEGEHGGEKTRRVAGCV